MSRATRWALGLWIALAVVVWNVVFDHTIEVAGRAYLRAAALAAHAGGPFARIDDWMRPAIPAGLWNASAAALVILALGLGGLLCASHLTR
jgi:hypothetical protein